MYKQMMKLFKPTPLENVYKGFFEVCDKTSLTMGLEGNLAVIASMYEGISPDSTKDGVKTCRSIFFDDPDMNVGAYFAKQAATRTLSLVGDNTTTTLVFAKSLVKNTKKLFGTYHFNSRVRQGMEEAQKDFLKQLKEIKSPCTGAKLRDIATISANNDVKIGKIVADAYKAVNNKGVVAVQQDMDSAETTLKVSEGFVFSKGWKSPALINKFDIATWEAEKVNVIVYEGNITTENGQDIADVLNEKRGEPFLLICEHISDDMMLNIVENNRTGKINVCAVEAPFYVDQRKAFLEDIALYLGTTPFIQGTSDKILTGKASKVIVSEGTTSIIQEEVSPAVAEKVAELRKSINAASEKDFVNKRITALEGKAVTIKVGEMSDGARKELFDRVEDSVAAVRAALEEGVISGGGSGLVYISNTMKRKFSNKDVQFGYDTLKKALEEPFRTVLSNAGVKANKYLKYSKKEYGKGYNLKTNTVTDMQEEGILDSVKGLRVALENALSVAILILNTKVVITSRS